MTIRIHKVFRPAVKIFSNIVTCLNLSEVRLIVLVCGQRYLLQSHLWQFASKFFKERLFNVS